MHIKKSISIILVCLILLVCFPLGSLADTVPLSTDKAVYDVGDPILVTANSNGQGDWVGIYLKGETPGPDRSICWYYVNQDGNASGDTKDIHDNEAVKEVVRPGLASFPAGEYSIFLLKNDGYEQLGRVDIEIRSKGTQETTPVESDTPLSTDKTTYAVGEAILVTANSGGHGDWVGIYLKGETPGPDRSICWYYVNQDGNNSGDTVDIHDNTAVKEVVRKSLAGFSAGEYSIFLLKNDGYEQLGRVDIVIGDVTPQEPVVYEQPSVPKSLTFKSTAKYKGLAEGYVSILTGDVHPISYLLYWGDASGKLPGYAAFAPIPYAGTTTRYTIPDHVIIPEGATRLLVYAVSGDKQSDGYAEAPIPEELLVSWSRETIEYEFQVISDTHVNASEEHLYTRHFKMALEDIKNVSPLSIGVFVVGDITDHATEVEYQMYNSLIASYGLDLPEFYEVAGNHDLNGPVSRFRTMTGNDSETPYFDMWLEGMHFIFLSGTQAGVRITLGETQLKWFSERLAENNDPEKPVFVFLHQSIKDTIAGSYTGQNWDGVDDYVAFSAVLKEYPNIIMFNGHSHWELNAAHSMYPATKNLPTIFNTASVGYTWNDESQKTNIAVNGSEGLYVLSRGGHLFVLGRDFENGLWLPSAQFIVEYGGLEAVELRESESLTETENDLPESEPTESDGENKPAGGCGSALTSSLWLTVIGGAAGVWILRKKKNRT